MQEIRGHSRKIYKEKMKSFYFYLLPNIEGVTHISSLYCVVELGMQISKDQHMLISTKKPSKRKSFQECYAMGICVALGIKYGLYFIYRLLFYYRIIFAWARFYVV